LEARDIQDEQAQLCIVELSKSPSKVYGFPTIQNALHLITTTIQQRISSCADDIVSCARDLSFYPQELIEYQDGIFVLLTSIYDSYDYVLDIIAQEDLDEFVRRCELSSSSQSTNIDESIDNMEQLMSGNKQENIDNSRDTPSSELEP
jgi:hypothetical protein